MGAEVSSVVSGAATYAGAAQAFGPAGFAVSVALAAVASVTTYQQVKKQERDRDRLSRQLTANTSGLRGVMFRQAITSRKVVYGQCLVSGPIVFMDTTNNNRTLHIVVPVAGHEIEGFDAFFIDGEHVPLVDTIDRSFGDPNTKALYAPVVGTKWRPTATSPRIVVETFTGADDQLASARLTEAVGAEVWGREHRLRGVAYFYAKLEYDRALFTRGIPNIACVVRGKKLYDPRSPDADPGWTDNAALVLRDYMTDTDYGLGFKASEIDDAEFVAAANAADTTVRLANPNQSTAHEHLPRQETILPSADGYLYLAADQQYIHNGDTVVVSDDLFIFFRQGFAVTNGAGGFRIAPTLAAARAGTDLITIPTATAVRTQRNRGLTYTINGQIDTTTNPRQVLRSLLDAQEASFVYTGGKIRLLRPGTPTKTGAYALGGNIIDESHTVSGIKFTPKVSRRDQVNTIKGVYIGPQNGWQPTDYPTTSLSQSVIESDGGELVADIPFEFTIAQSMAQRLSRGILSEERRQRTVTFAMDLKGLRFQVGDFIYIRRNNWNEFTGGTITQLFTDIPYRIVAFDLIPEVQGTGVALRVNITAKESPPRPVVLDINDEQPIALSPSTRLPNPAAGIVPPTGLTLASGNNVLVLGSDGTVASVLRATWTPPVTGFAAFYELGYKQTGEDETAWRSVILPATAITYDLSPVDDGVQYDVRIRSQSTNGLHSGFARVNNHRVLGKTEPPPTPLQPVDVITLPDGTRRFEFDITTAPADVRFGGGGVLIKYSDDLSATWDNMTLLRDRFRASPYETQDIREGRYRFGIKWQDSSGNESAEARFSEHVLGRQNIGETFLQRRESDADNNWPGTLGTNTIKVRRSAAGDRQLMARLPAGTDYRNLPRTSGDEAATWDDRVFTPLFIDYTTPVISLPNPVTFAAIVEMEYTGFIHTRTIRYSNTLTSGGALSSPSTLTFEEGQPTGAITARYVQVTVQVRPPSVSGGAVRQNAVLRQMDIRLSGDTVGYTYENLNTATTTPIAGFNRLAAGRFTVEHLGGAGSILTAIVQFQGVQTGGNLTARVINKNALTAPKAGAEVRIYNQANQLTDAVIDVELRGPRRGLVRDPVDSTG